jgi:DNA-directed RNA polymerase II subunit RPB1
LRVLVLFPRAGHTNLDPVDVVKKVKELCTRLVVVPGEDSLSKEAQRNATFMFHALVRSQLASKRLLKVRYVTQSALTPVNRLHLQMHEP